MTEFNIRNKLSHTSQKDINGLAKYVEDRINKDRFNEFMGFVLVSGNFIILPVWIRAITRVLRFIRGWNVLQANVRVMYSYSTKAPDFLEDITHAFLDHLLNGKNTFNKNSVGGYGDDELESIRYALELYEIKNAFISRTNKQMYFTPDDIKKMFPNLT